MPEYFVGCLRGPALYDGSVVTRLKGRFVLVEPTREEGCLSAAVLVLQRLYGRKSGSADSHGVHGPSVLNVQCLFLSPYMLAMCRIKVFREQYLADRWTAGSY